MPILVADFIKIYNLFAFGYSLFLFIVLIVFL
jgi:hypothetical protein